MKPLPFVITPVLLITLAIRLAYAVPYSSNCQPVGPYPYPVAVIPSINERYLVVSASMHVQERDDSITPPIPPKCSSGLNLDALLMIEALLYSKDTFSVRTSQQLGTEPLGLMILDNCGDAERTAQDLINFESCTLAFAPQASFGGPMVFPDDAVFYFVVDYKVGTLARGIELERKLMEANLRNKPVIRLSEYDEVPERLIKALALVLHRLLYKNVAVIFSDTAVGRHRWSIFRNFTDSFEICTQNYKLSISASDNAASAESKATDLLKSIAEDETIRVLVILTDSGSTANILDAARRVDLIRRWHWLGFCASLKNLQESDETSVPPGSVMLARENDLTDFYEYINAERDVGSAPWVSTRNPWLDEYYASFGRCNRSDCTPPSILKRFQENQWLQYNDLITEVVSAYDAASMAWSEQGQVDSRLESMTRSLRRSSLASIMILNYRHTSKGWRFVRVGTVRDGSEIRLEPGTVQTYMPLAIDSRNSCPNTCHFCDSYKRRALPDLNGSILESPDRQPGKINMPVADFLHRTDLWACLLTGFAASMILMIFIYEAYAVTKICHRLPRVSAVAQSGIFLSQGLLYGVFLESVSVFSITVAPNFYVCAIQRFLPGIGCVLCYSVMFAKLLVLISARQGQYLAACYQALVVILFLAMQTIVSIHWLPARPLDDVHLNFSPEALNDTSGLFIVSLNNIGKYEHGCNLSFFDYLKMLILPLCLIGLCAVTAALTRKNPYNYRETTFIALAAFSNGAIWTIWICLGILIKKDGLQDAALGYGMLTNAFVLTVVMFLPSSRQKTATGEGIGLHPEDVMGLKSAASNGPTWTKYLIGPSNFSTPVASPKRKNAATQSTVHRQSKRLNRVRPIKPELDHMAALPSTTVHAMILQKAMAHVNSQLNGVRSVASGLDPGGSAVTLDVAGSLQTIQLPPPPPPMSLFNSHWKLQMKRHPSCNTRSQAVPVAPPRISAPSPKEAQTQDIMVYSSFGGSIAGEPQQPKQTSMPKPVFPTVLTPAKLLRGDDVSTEGTMADPPEITYAHVCKHAPCSKKPATVIAPYKPLLRYPAYYLYRSRSSQDIRQCRKRCGLCLHSNLYRSRSFSDTNKNREGAEIKIGNPDIKES